MSHNAQYVGWSLVVAVLLWRRYLVLRAENIWLRIRIMHLQIKLWWWDTKDRWVNASMARMIERGEHPEEMLNG